MSNRKLDLVKKYELAKLKIMEEQGWTSKQFDENLREYESLKTQYNEIKKIKNRLNTGKIMKLGKRNLDTGSVIKLYLEEDMCEKYDPQLKYLVEGNHRFVIGVHFGLKSNCVPIHLLSTSKLANEDYKNGGKLAGNYTGFDKDVFIDLNTIWFIKKNCIKSYEYHLDDADLYVLGRIVRDRNFADVECKIGTTSSNIFKNEFDDYKYLFSSPIIAYDNSKEIEFIKESGIEIAKDTFGSYQKCQNIVNLYGMPGHNNELNYNLAKVLIKAADKVTDVIEKNKIINQNLERMFDYIPEDVFEKLEINMQRGYDYHNIFSFINEGFEEKYLDKIYKEEWEDLTNDIMDTILVKLNDMGIDSEDIDKTLENARQDLARKKDSIIFKSLIENLKEGKRGFSFKIYEKKNSI